MIGKKNHPSIYERGIKLKVVNTDANIVGDWRIKIIEYLEDPNRMVSHWVKAQSQNFILLEGELYKKGPDGLLLRCLSFPDRMEVMKQVHKGVCGAHQAGIKMRSLIRRHGYFWSTILSDCINYSKGCQQRQKYGNIQRILVVELHSIVKPWPFRGWAMDLIRKIYPTSSKGHNFILVSIYHFTKLVEAVPLKMVKKKDVIQFIKEHIINIFGIPQSITTDQGTMFTRDEMTYFAKDYGIQLIIFTPFYAQENGHAEASNKVLISILEKVLENNPRDLHIILLETLWTYRTSKRGSTGVSFYFLTYR